MSFIDRMVVAGLPLMPKFVVRQVAKPYVAGETLPEQAAVIRGLNGEGFRVATCILGEFVERREEAEAAVREYEEVLAAFKRDGLDSTIHIKLSHFGLKLDKEFCFQNLRRLLGTAREAGNFVRIDMEDASCTDDTLEIYRRARREFENVGTVLQACLRRTLADARALGAERANLRLCKGIYIEPHEIAFRDPEIIRSNYLKILEELLGAGCFTAIATHDERLVWGAERIIERLGVDKARYEFQMLHGVLPGLRKVIRAAGHTVRVAVPFGPNWYPYSLRRLRKNPAIAGHVFRAMLGKWIP